MGFNSAFKGLKYVYKGLLYVVCESVRSSCKAVVKTVTNIPFPKEMELDAIDHTSIVLVFLL